MKNILIVGTGPMSVAYINVLKMLNLNIDVVGRGEKSAKTFFDATGIYPKVGGLDKYLKNTKLNENTYAIIATGTENLMNTMKLLLLNQNISKILIEKPAAISIDELVQNEKLLLDHKEKIFVAYNRRFYSSVLETKKLIKEDGGLESMHFEFTEWAHKIEEIKKAPGVKENWFFANSTHVVDIAFFIAGKPKELATFSKKGKISWHEKTNFAGAGITESQVIFSYISNWESAGRWAIELMTNKRRIYLKPLEEIKIQMKGSIEVTNYDFDDSLDKKFKPGLYLQIECFVNDKTSSLLNISDHIYNTKHVYSKILK